MGRRGARRHRLASCSARASGAASCSATARASASRGRGWTASRRFYERHGAKAILVGRFVGIVRAVSPFLAGSSGLPFRRFLPWSILGTAIWASAFTLVGYAFSESFSEAAGTLTHGAFALAVIAAVVLAVRAHRRHAVST